ncbi:MAG: hypothetical protein C0596_10465 [Marinilabiliales bacterium]|nr:MAG: hypothetical protein C0596_10465 [Marinilabiliales bacterium]
MFPDYQHQLFITLKLMQKTVVVEFIQLREHSQLHVQLPASLIHKDLKMVEAYLHAGQTKQ